LLIFKKNQNWGSCAQGRSQAWAWGGLSLPKQKYSPPNEIKPISPFGLMFFARFVLKQNSAACGTFFR